MSSGDSTSVSSVTTWPSTVHMEQGGSAVATETKLSSSIQSATGTRVVPKIFVERGSPHPEEEAVRFMILMVCRA